MIRILKAEVEVESSSSLLLTLLHCSSDQFLLSFVGTVSTSPLSPRAPLLTRAGTAPPVTGMDSSL